jgi:hypothetical protein
LRAAGETREIRYDPDEFHLVVDGRAEGSDDYEEFNLAGPYSDWRAAPRGRRQEEVVRRYAAGRLFEVPRTFAEVRDRLVPILRHRLRHVVRQLRSRLGELPESQGEPMLYPPLAEHLTVGLAIDMPDTIVEVTGGLLGGWGVSADEAMNLARDNLRRMSAGGPRPLAPGVWSSPWYDNHDVSRLVLEDLVRDCEVKGDYVAMVPERHTLLVTGSDDPAGLLVMLRFAEEALRQLGSRPISNIPVRLRHGAWAPYAPDTEHADHPELKGYQRLRLKERAEDYHEQTELLRRLYEKAGEQVIVSYCGRADHEKTGAAFTFCTWSEYVPNLLPRADYVTFGGIKPGGEGELIQVAFADWERVLSVVGGLMQKTDHWPERFRVDSFPTAEHWRVPTSAGGATCRVS